MARIPPPTDEEVAAFETQLTEGMQAVVADAIQSLEPGENLYDAVADAVDAYLQAVFEDPHTKHLLTHTHFIECGAEAKGKLDDLESVRDRGGIRGGIARDRTADRFRESVVEALRGGDLEATGRLTSRECESEELGEEPEHGLSEQQQRDNDLSR